MDYQQLSTYIPEDKACLVSTVGYINSYQPSSTIINAPHPFQSFSRTR